MLSTFNFPAAPGAAVGNQRGVDVSDAELTSSMEDYLEAVLGLQCEGGAARVRDIAGRLDVSMSAVTAAMRALAARGLVHYDPYRQVPLTEPGRRAAEEITDRHQVLRRFLTKVLGLSPAVAEANACRMEHVVDKAVLDRLAAFGRFVAAWPPMMQKQLNDSLVGPRTGGGAVAKAGPRGSRKPSRG